jgi:hypothetical protein
LIRRGRRNRVSIVEYFNRAKKKVCMALLFQKMVLLLLKHSLLDAERSRWVRLLVDIDVVTTDMNTRLTERAENK